MLLLLLLLLRLLLLFPVRAVYKLLRPGITAATADLLRVHRVQALSVIGGLTGEGVQAEEFGSEDLNFEESRLRLPS